MSPPIVSWFIDPSDYLRWNTPAAKRRRRDDQQEYTPEQWAKWRRQRAPKPTETPGTGSAAGRPSAAPSSAAAGGASAPESAPAESKAAAVAVNS